MKKIINNESLERGSSIIIALVLIVLVIFLLNHYGITFASVWHAIKNFFGLN